MVLYDLSQPILVAIGGAIGGVYYRLVEDHVPVGLLSIHLVKVYQIQNFFHRSCEPLENMDCLLLTVEVLCQRLFDLVAS